MWPFNWMILRALAGRLFTVSLTVQRLILVP